MKKIFTLLAVAAMAFASQATVLTICDGGAEGYASGSVPIYGLWADTQGTTGQMIYSADMLEDMVGCVISEVKFYTTAYYYQNYGDIANAGSGDYINFDGATVQLSLKVVEENGFAGTYIEGATPVATTVPVLGDANMTFTLDEPFVYEGGNLLIECKIIATEGDYGGTYFFGTSPEDEDAPHTSYYGYPDYNGNWSEADFAFLPMVSFTYEEAVAEPKYYLAGFNDWENLLEIGEEGVTVDVAQQDFNDLEDTAQEFKIITHAADGEPIWLGGVDENGVGHFDITEALLDRPITLDDTGANFRLPEPGNYTIHLSFLDKSPVSHIMMFVTKNAATAIESINSDVKGDNAYYNLMGQKFTGNNLPAGIYIHNGKKVIVR